MDLDKLISLRDKPREAYDYYLANKDSISDQHAVDFELGIICFYIDKKREGLDAINRLLLSPPIDGSLAAATYHNLNFYVEQLPVKKWTDVEAEVPSGFHCHNPSIIPYRCWYLVSIRASNRLFLPDGRLQVDGGKHRVKNYLQLLDSDLKPIWTKPFQDKENSHVFEFLAAEDIRLLATEPISFTCTSHTVHSEGTYRMYRGQISSLEEQPVPITTHKLTSLFPMRDERDWLAFDDKYLYNPCTIVTEEEVVKQREPIGRLACSAGPLRYRGGLLFLVREVGHGAIYHRFCLWGDEYRVSDPFYFHHRGLETAMSICWYGDNLLVSLGIQDKRACLAEIERSTLDKLLDTSTVV